MIYVTQGHEGSIAFETFYKSIQMLPNESLKNFTYIASKDVVLKNIEDLAYNPTIENDKIRISKNKFINCLFLESNFLKSSLDSIIQALKIIKKNDILITLPTSKDKFKYQDKIYTGHTEFFRNYLNKNLTMNFINEDEQVLILTDHVPINCVTQKLNSQYIIEQIEISIFNLKKYFNRTITDVLISGINPHAGENGIISNDDINVFSNVVKRLAKKHDKIKFTGPISADTLFVQIKNSKKTLQVFCHHDQALTYFKFKNGFIGNNTTFGLNFLRLSVDHGTASDLYGLNKSNPLGSYFVLKTAIEIHERNRL